MLVGWEGDGCVVGRCLLLVQNDDELDLIDRDDDRLGIDSNPRNLGRREFVASGDSRRGTYVNAQLMDDAALKDDGQGGNELLNVRQTQFEIGENDIATPEGELEIFATEFHILINVREKPWRDVRFKFEHI